MACDTILVCMATVALILAVLAFGFGVYLYLRIEELRPTISAQTERQDIAEGALVELSESVANHHTIGAADKVRTKLMTGPRTKI